MEKLRTNRRILIIGGAGYVGSALCSMLTGQDETYAVFDNFSVGSEASVPAGVKIYTGDIRKTTMLRAAFKDFQPTHVVHLAALHFIPYCVKHPIEVMAVNVLGVQNILDTIRKTDKSIELIFASSAAVYKDSIDALAESDELEQIDIYGFSKALGEKLIRAQSGRYKVARFFNVYGNHDIHPHVIPRIFNELTEGKSLLKMGNVEAERDYVHVDDVARALIDIIEKGKNKATYNVGTGESLSVKALVQEMMGVVGHSPKLVENTAEFARKSDRMVLKADISRISEDTGWQPSVSLKEGLATLR